MAIIPFVLLLLQGWYCYRKYPETHINISSLKIKENPYLKSMGAFASFAFFGNIGWTVRNQGFSIILNIFWGVIINAANGIANQVSSALMVFSNSLTTSLRPQLIQAAGENNASRMVTLMFAACRYPLIVTSLFGIPLFITMPYVLRVWLTEVPEYSVLFCRILILDILINQSTLGLTITLDAKGEIKWLHILVGSTLILTACLAYGVGMLIKNVELVYGCLIIGDIAIFIIRLFLTRHYLKKWGHEFNGKDYLINIIFKSFFTCGVAILIGLKVWQVNQPSLWWCITMIISSMICYGCLAWLILVQPSERKGFINIIKNTIKLK